MDRFNPLHFIFNLAVLTSCVSPFDFQPEVYQKILVVEGILTNETTQHTIKLNYTYPLDSGRLEGIEGAEVYLINSNSATIFFNDEGNGIYKTSPDFAGQSGESYKLSVVTANGDKYESEFEELITAPPIDSLYDEYVEFTSIETNQKQGGLQFFLDNKDLSNKAKYYRYEYEETYQVYIPFPSLYQVVNDSILTRRSHNVSICYENNESNAIIIGTSVNNVDNRLSRQPITFLSQINPKTKSNYSILVKQHAVSKSAYQYYKVLKENNVAAGSIFDKQVGTVLANVINVNDPAEPVLGYFEVSGVSEYRHTLGSNPFKNNELPDELSSNCISNARLMNANEAAIFVNSNKDWEVVELRNEAGATMGLLEYAWIMPRKCTSCN